MTKTRSTKSDEIKRDWHLVNLRDLVLGRIATQMAGLLMGKNKPYFMSCLDCGDYVVAVNAAQVKVTGRKAKQKKYYRHSGYPGGFKEISFAKQMIKDPTRVVYQAVSGMLPKNKLRKKRLARLKIFSDDKHPYGDKFKLKAQMSKLKI